ncbi:hypothetical protein ACFT8W_17495 [Streptomyces hygroscopicus]|uniref:hypothetical protein n=1 Tax=Streptomyces hygroscopicus TaxID=1912 RepID=UPI00363885CE
MAACTSTTTGPAEPWTRFVPHLAQITGGTGAKAITESGIETTRWHRDSTSLLARR